MLAPEDKQKQSFAIVYVDGSIRLEAGPNANDQTLLLMNRCLQRVIPQVTARGHRSHTGSEAAQATRDEPSEAPGALPGELMAMPGAPTISIACPAPPSLSKARVPVADDSRQAPLADKAEAVKWLSGAIDEWRFNSGVRFSAQSWTYSYKPTFRVFLELIGDIRRDRELPDGSIGYGLLDIDVRKLGRTHIEALVMGLTELPARQGKRDDAMEALERIEYAKVNKGRRPSLSSIAKKLGHIRPFLEYADKKGWLHAGVMQEMKLAVSSAESKVRTQQSAAKQQPGCVALNPEELRRMFEQPAFADGAARAPWCYWVPLICLYQGLRVSEAAQLYTDDIFEVDGVPCLSVIADSTEGDDSDGEAKATKGRQGKTARTSDEYRRIKNQASRRVAPVHPELIRLGFLQFVAERRKYAAMPAHLFYGLRWEEKSMFGRKPSEFMRKLLRVAGIAQKRRKVPHSLRSNFKQELEKTMLPDNLQKRLLGHTTQSIKDTNYNETDLGPAFPVREALPFLARMDFGLSIPVWSEICTSSR